MLARNRCRDFAPAPGLSEAYLGCPMVGKIASDNLHRHRPNESSPHRRPPLSLARLPPPQSPTPFHLAMIPWLGEAGMPSIASVPELCVKNPNRSPKASRSDIFTPKGHILPHSLWRRGSIYLLWSFQLLAMINN